MSASCEREKFSLADVSVNESLHRLFSLSFSFSPVDVHYGDPWYFSDKSIVFGLSCLKAHFRCLSLSLLINNAEIIRILCMIEAKKDESVMGANCLSRKLFTGQ